MMMMMTTMMMMISRLIKNAITRNGLSHCARKKNVFCNCLKRFCDVYRTIRRQTNSRSVKSRTRQLSV